MVVDGALHVVEVVALAQVARPRPRDLPRLLFEGHAVEEVRDSLRCGRVGALIRRRVGVCVHDPYL